MRRARGCLGRAGKPAGRPARCDGRGGQWAGPGAGASAASRDHRGVAKRLGMSGVRRWRVLAWSKTNSGTGTGAGASSQLASGSGAWPHSREPCAGGTSEGSPRSRNLADDRLHPRGACEQPPGTGVLAVTSRAPEHSVPHTSPPDCLSAGGHAPAIPESVHRALGLENEHMRSIVGSEPR